MFEKTEALSLNFQLRATKPLDFCSALCGHAQIVFCLLLYHLPVGFIELARH